MRNCAIASIHRLLGPQPTSPKTNRGRRKHLRRSNSDGSVSSLFTPIPFSILNLNGTPRSGLRPVDRVDRKPITTITTIIITIFPVDRMGIGYAALWNAFKHIAKGASAAEKTALFAGTATKVYRLELP